MQKPFIADQEYEGQDYSKNPLPKAEYEHCIFRNCKFSDGFLDNQTFMECEFVECDLTNANIKHTTFKECHFKGSKLVGLRFEDCNTLFLSMKFEGCNLSFASFYELTIPQTYFKDCTLEETDFTQTNLIASSFDHCNLNKTIFHQTVLEKVDFRTAFNLSINPEQNQLKKTRFSKESCLGLLKKYDIVIT